MFTKEPMIERGEMMTYKVGEHGGGNDAPMQTLGDQPRPLNEQP